MAEDKISKDEIRQYELEQDINILLASIQNSNYKPDIKIYKAQLKNRRAELKQVKKRIKQAKKN